MSLIPFSWFTKHSACCEAHTELAHTFPCSVAITSSHFDPPLVSDMQSFILSNFYQYLSEFLYHIGNVFSTLFPIPDLSARGLHHHSTSVILIYSNTLPSCGLCHTWNLKPHDPSLWWQFPILPTLCHSNSTHSSSFSVCQKLCLFVLVQIHGF